MLNRIFAKVVNKSVTAYLDDMLVYFDTFEEHVEHVRKVFQILLDKALHVKEPKCELFKREELRVRVRGS